MLQIYYKKVGKPNKISFFERVLERISLIVGGGRTTQTSRTGQSNGKCEFRAGSGRGRQGRQGEVKGGKKIGQTRRSKGEVGAARDNGVRNLGVRIILL